MKEFSPLPAGYSPAEEGNVTWKLDADKIQYVEFHELIHAYLDAQLSDDAVSSNEPALSRHRRFNTLCTYRSSIPIGSSDQCLNTYHVLPRHHVALFNLEGAQVRQAYTTLWNYDTVATDIDILGYVHAFLDNPVVDP